MDFGYCPECKKSYAAGKFCYICGTSLSQETFTPLICKCGEELFGGDNYCRWCGIKLEEKIKEKR